MIFYETGRSDPINYLYIQHDHNLTFPLHLHSSLEFLLMLEGELTCTIQGTDHILKKGMGILLLPNQPHSYHTSTESRSILWVFSPDWVPDFMEEMNDSEFAVPVLTVSETGQIVQMLSEKSNRSLKRAALNLICGRLLQERIKQKRASDETRLSGQLISFLQNHYTEDITLHSIARDLGYNYTYLSAAFNRIFGTGFCEFLNQYRISYAEELLKSTDLPIIQIAEQCGFGSLRSFNRVFSNMTNMSPSEYRCGHRK